jgi:hypothetical protein
VRGSDDLKADATMAIAFPVDPNQWRNTGFWPARLKTTAVSSTGVYRFTTLPAGDYYVAAISRNQASIWRDAAVLTQLARTAPRVTLIWGGRASVDVNVTVIK